MALMQFPGTNFHDLNLDWLLEQMKNCLAQWAETKENWDDTVTEWHNLEADNTEFKEYVTNYLHNLDISPEVSAKIDAMAEDGSLLALITADDGEGSALSDVAGQWLNAHMTPEQEALIDDTLTVSGAAADAKVTGDRISDLNNAFNTGYYSITDLVGGSFNATGTLTIKTDRLRENDFIHIKKGDKIVIDNGSLLHAVGAWDGTPSSSTIVRNDNSFSSSNETIVSTLDDGYYIIVFKNSSGTTISPSDFDGSINVYSNEIYRNTKRIEAVDDRVDNANEDIEALEDKLSKAVTAVDFPQTTTIDVTLENTANYYMDTSAGLHENSSYRYSQKISVVAGDVVTPISTVSGAQFRYVCAFTDNTAVSAKGSSTGVTSFTVPESINYIVVSTSVAGATTGVRIVRNSGTITKYYPVVQEFGYNRWSGSLLDGDNVSLLRTQVRFNTVWAFTGHITTAGKIIIGVTQGDSTPKTLCAVDSTKLYYRLQNGDVTSTNHGLTLANDLQIWIYNPFVVNELGGIKIASNGNEFVLNATAYGTEMNGAPCVISDGAVISDCAFTLIPQDINKPIWVFGDSWVSMYDTRWPYYMVQAGYTHTWMLSGFTGQKSAEAITSLENLLTIRKPEYIVWMMGMNDIDSSSAVNTDWKTAYDKLIEICTDFDITPILYTVPNTPSRVNTYKNAVVTASGYRYIDGVAAVGDDGNGNWFTDYWQSSNDKNHTSAKGAKALYMRILTDFPEIAENGL